MTLSRILLICVLLSCVSCDDGYLRGSVEPSPDAGSYLVVAEGNNCSQIRIDGVDWPYVIGERGSISPGDHVIDCNGEIHFSIPERTIFIFDYWGP